MHLQHCGYHVVQDFLHPRKRLWGKGIVLCQEVKYLSIGGVRGLGKGKAYTSKISMLLRISSLGNRGIPLEGSGDGLRV